jgi:hypothetical protein
MQEVVVKKRFNVTGPCIPGRDYMVDTTPLIQTIIRDYVEKGKYFVINRARQYGKTTTLFRIGDAISPRTYTISLSFEGIGNAVFESESAFIKALIELSADSMQEAGVPESLIAQWRSDSDNLAMYQLGMRISQLVKESGRDMVLMIDEVDKSSDYQVFLSFLGMLREKYNQRANRKGYTFQSVILVGVHDIKNLKAKIRPESEHSYNSPWNIAADFTLDMSFATEQIAGMLAEYEADHHTGMDTYALAKVIRDQTAGYPFLVSALCKRLDEVTQDWTVAGLHAAVAHLLSTTNTLFDDIIKNLQRHAEFRSIVEDILLNGERVTYAPSDPGISLGEMFGILVKVGLEVRITNVIFEQYIYNHIVSVNRKKLKVSSDEMRLAMYVKNGCLDMRLVLERFASLMKAEHRAEYGRLIEKEWRLLFLIFLRPITNGTGTYAVEAETRSSTRMDLVVFYGNEEHIVELKIWHGQKHEAEAYSQLAGYLEARGQRRGYLISFCNLKNPPKRSEWIEYGGCMIYEEIVSYSSDAEG